MAGATSRNRLLRWTAIVAVNLALLAVLGIAGRAGVPVAVPGQEFLREVISRPAPESDEFGWR